MENDATDFPSFTKKLSLTPELRERAGKTRHLLRNSRLFQIALGSGKGQGFVMVGKVCCGHESTRTLAPILYTFLRFSTRQIKVAQVLVFGLGSSAEMRKLGRILVHHVHIIRCERLLEDCQ